MSKRREARRRRQVLARRAHRPLLEGRDRRELADDRVALGGVVPAAIVIGVVMDDLAEDVARELLVVAALEDELVGLVDLGEHPAARAAEQDVGHDVGEGEDLVGEPEPEHLLAQRPVVLARAGEESGRDDGDPEAARADPPILP